jgi:hypothetical protein
MTVLRPLRGGEAAVTAAAAIDADRAERLRASCRGRVRADVVPTEGSLGAACRKRPGDEGALLESPGLGAARAGRGGRDLPATRVAGASRPAIPV